MINNKALNPLWDADGLVYAVGFACKDHEPLAYCLQTVKEAVKNTLDLFPERQYEKIFISGKGNFRNKLGTIKVYKGNRDPSIRPKYYDEIRQYLIDYCGAIVVDGMEAEDACGIEQWAHKDKSTVIISVDKDLDCIPGFRYNPHPKHLDLKYISLADANFSFWKQVLTGDSTDNIQGIKGMGPKTAEKLLLPYKGDWMKMAEMVTKEYDRAYGLDGRSAMKETASLVWILREAGRTFDGTQVGN